MAKEKTLGKIKIIASIVVAIIAVITALFAIERYFAKNSTVSLIDERLEISILEDRIYEKERDIERIRDLNVFQRVENPEPTEAEKEIIKKSEDRLEELKEQRSIKIEQYEQSR